MKMKTAAICMWWTLNLTGLADLKVAALHPVLTDVAQQVGGKEVEVVSMLKIGGDPHDFSPSAGDIREMSSSQLILASGKGIEPYLAKLTDSLGADQRILEVGRSIPSLTISEKDDLFVCCPNHSEGGLDPHWWHSVKNVQRAAKIMAKAFGELDAANKSAYQRRAQAYDKRLDELAKWARKEIARVPRSDRRLVTAHAAYSYFCKEFGFKSMPVQGLTKGREASSRHLAEVIAELKKQKIKAVFPEAQANPKVLQEMVRGSGARVGGVLLADYTGDEKRTTFEAMFRHNVETIVAGLAPETVSGTAPETR